MAQGADHDLKTPPGLAAATTGLLGSCAVRRRVARGSSDIGRGPVAPRRVLCWGFSPLQPSHFLASPRSTPAACRTAPIGHGSALRASQREGDESSWQGLAQSPEQRSMDHGTSACLRMQSNRRHPVSKQGTWIEAPPLTTTRTHRNRGPDQELEDRNALHKHRLEQTMSEDQPRSGLPSQTPGLVRGESFAEASPDLAGPNPHADEATPQFVERNCALTEAGPRLAQDGPELVESKLALVGTSPFAAEAVPVLAEAHLDLVETGSRTGPVTT